MIDDPSDRAISAAHPLSQSAAETLGQRRAPVQAVDRLRAACAAFGLRAIGPRQDPGDAMTWAVYLWGDPVRVDAAANALRDVAHTLRLDVDLLAIRADTAKANRLSARAAAVVFQSLRFKNWWQTHPGGGLFLDGE